MQNVSQRCKAKVIKFCGELELFRKDPKGGIDTYRVNYKGQVEARICDSRGAPYSCKISSSNYYLLTEFAFRTLRY